MRKDNLDFINYGEKKRSPLDLLVAHYSKTGEAVPDKDSHGYEELKKRYEQNPNSLNATEILMLGFYEQQLKRKEKDQKNRHEYGKQVHQYNEEEAEYKEMISTNSEEYKALSRNIAELQDALSKLANGEE